MTYVRMTDVRQRLVEMGFDPLEDTPAQYAASLRQDVEMFSAVARRMGMGVAKLGRGAARRAVLVTYSAATERIGEIRRACA